MNEAAHERRGAKVGALVPKRPSGSRCDGHPEGRWDNGPYRARCGGGNKKGRLKPALFGMPRRRGGVTRCDYQLKLSPPFTDFANSTKSFTQFSTSSRSTTSLGVCM